MALGAAGLVSSTAQAAPESGLSIGDDVWVGDGIGYGGTQLWPVWSDIPEDLSDPGEPDYWVYCIEHGVPARSGIEGLVGSAGDFPGDNRFSDPAVQEKVYWILAHAYPAVDLADFAAAAGLPSISENDAIEATQYAIWRYTEMTWDASWDWETDDSQAAYWYLVNGANASDGTALGGLQAEVSVTAPAAEQAADSLVGPFTIHTNRPIARAVTNPALSLVDVSGVAIDADAITDGQQIYVDLRGSTGSGTVTVSAFARGSGSSGLIVSAPAMSGGTPTAENHSQTRIVIADHTQEVGASASASWSGEAEPVGNFTIVKVVEGDASDLVASDREFTVEARWDGGSSSFQVRNDGVVVTSPDLPRGVEITVSETVVPEIRGVEWGTYRLACDTDEDGGWGRGLPAIGNTHSFEFDANDQNTASVTCTLTNTANRAPAGPAPVIGTSLVDAVDGDRVLPWNGGAVVDTVTYRNLTPGTVYTVFGELMHKNDGTGTGITSSATFSPTSADGSIQLTFLVPEGYAGTSLVAFEWLFEGETVADRDDAVAEHTDIDDAAQTVTVEEAPQRTLLSATGGQTPFLAMGIASLLVIAGLSASVVARRL